MTHRTNAITILIVLAFAFLPGCSLTRPAKYRSPSEVLVDIGESMLDMFEETELDTLREEGYGFNNPNGISPWKR